MNWKEFLKPDWKKILIAIILFAIDRFIYQYMTGVVLNSNPLSTSEVILNHIFAFIVFYLISCLIVWIYNKVRKK